jgi:hypothetical protein
MAATLMLSACGGGAATSAQGNATNSSARSQVASLAVAAAVAANDLKVVALTKVSETRVSRTVYDYVLKVSVHNAGMVAFNDIVLTLRSVGAGSSVVDGRVAISSLAAGANVQPSDTITIRQDRTVAFNAAAITWTIDGIPVMPTPKEQVATLEASEALPKLDRSASLLGPLTVNGVREDIEAHIVKAYSTAPQQAAAMQTARALQNTLVVDVSNLTAVLDVNRKLTYAVHCLHTKFDRNGASKHPAQVSQELESMLTNTKPRLLAYLAFAKSLDGQTWGLPEGDTCD